MRDRELDALAVEKILGNGVGIISDRAELALLLEDRIEERGLQEQYIQALDKLVTYERREGWEWFRWGILRATPAQRRDAALKATGNL